MVTNDQVGRALSVISDYCKQRDDLGLIASCDDCYIRLWCWKHVCNGRPDDWFEKKHPKSLN